MSALRSDIVREALRRELSLRRFEVDDCEPLDEPADAAPDCQDLVVPVASARARRRHCRTIVTALRVRLAATSEDASATNKLLTDAPSRGDRDRTSTNSPRQTPLNPRSVSSRTRLCGARIPTSRPSPAAAPAMSHVMV